MPKIQKSKSLYKTPFSRDYWRDAAAELKDTKMLVFAAMMIALRVALKLVAIPLAPNLKINTAFLANALGAMVFGPVVAVVAAVASDVLGVMITGDIYFPPFVLTEIAGSLIFALFLYRAKLSSVRVMLARFCISFFVNILLQTPIMMLYYKFYMGGTSYVLTVPQILKNLYLFPVESVVLTMFLSVIQPITYRMKLSYDSAPRLKFEKKQIAMLAALFAAGAVCVVLYLGYHYDHTSLTTGYSAEVQAEKSREMHALVTDRTDGGINGPSVAVIEYAKKEFLGREVTYTVAYYAVDPEIARTEGLDAYWGLKKSAAANHEDLTRAGTAVIVVEEKTGAVLEFTYTPEG